jgi:meiotic recombination protein SPO11
MYSTRQHENDTMRERDSQVVQRDTETPTAIDDCYQEVATTPSASRLIPDIVPELRNSDALDCILSDDTELASVTSSDVIQRIEELATNIVVSLDRGELPAMSTYQSIISSDQEQASNRTMKRFTINQCRSFTSVLLVAAFCHSLIIAERTTTNREVYYFYVTHFRSQKECDAAIWDLCSIIQTPRHMLNLMASPKGWFCGDIQLISKSDQTSPIRENEEGSVLLLDGRSLPSVHGSPISSEWLQPYSRRNFSVQTIAATCILVIEKEGVYNRLSEDGFYRDYPCILITGKGFPDFATRAMVHTLHRELNLPVRGLSDCNPFGIMVLNTYQGTGTQNRRVAGAGMERLNVPIEWVGLRPSQVSHIMSSESTIPDQTLPQEIFQELTHLDKKRLFGTLLKENEHHSWTNFGQDRRRVKELVRMQHWKVELEALNWLGMDFCSSWLGRIFNYNSNEASSGSNNGESETTGSRKADEWLKII